MPQLMWKHQKCRCRMSGALLGTPTCSDGLRGGVLDGWHRTMYEGMAAYQYAYGLKPIGPHRVLADEILTPLRATCAGCKGRGVFTAVPGTGWRACPACEGTCGYWTCTDEELAEARGKVLEAFPDAMGLDTPSRFLGAVVILHMDCGWGQMIVANEDVQP